MTDTGQSSKLRILLFSPSFLPSIGGREIVVYYLARALNEQGHDCRVVGVFGRRRLAGLDFGFPVMSFPTLLSRLVSGKDLKRQAL